MVGFGVVRSRVVGFGVNRSWVVGSRGRVVRSGGRVIRSGGRVVGSNRGGVSYRSMVNRGVGVGMGNASVIGHSGSSTDKGKKAEDLKYFKPITWMSTTFKIF